MFRKNYCIFKYNNVRRHSELTEISNQFSRHYWNIDRNDLKRNGRPIICYRPRSVRHLFKLPLAGPEGTIWDFPFSESTTRVSFPINSVNDRVSYRIRWRDRTFFQDEVFRTSSPTTPPIRDRRCPSRVRRTNANTSLVPRIIMFIMFDYLRLFPRPSPSGRPPLFAAPRPVDPSHVPRYMFYARLACVRPRRRTMALFK